MQACCVVLACAVGVGVRHDTGLRAMTSTRGIGWLKGLMPQRGLGSALRFGPTTAADAFLTNGLSPPIGASMPGRG